MKKCYKLELKKQKLASRFKKNNKASNFFLNKTSDKFERVDFDALVQKINKKKFGSDLKKTEGDTMLIRLNQSIHSKALRV